MFKFKCVIALFVALFLSACASKQISQDAQTANSNERKVYVLESGKLVRVPDDGNFKPNPEKLKAECDKNNAKSCAELGFYFYIISTDIDDDDVAKRNELLKIAKNYLLKSCNDLNYGDGCVYYTEVFMYGEFVKLNPAETKDKQSFVQKMSKHLPTLIKYFQKACSLNSPIGCKGLGDAYVVGEGVKKDEKIGFSYRKKGCDLSKTKDERLQDKGNNCLNVGRMYYLGKGTSANKTLALQYFLKGCDFWGFGCSNWVEIFYKGYNDEKNKVPQDYKFAFELAKKGCEMNDGKSCNYLGILYGNGQGTAKDLNKAFRAFYKLCNQEIYGETGYEASGCHNLALCYANGWGVEQNYQRAFGYFKKLCDESEHSSACAMTGDYYFNAKGVRQDYRKAVEYFGKACDMGEQSGCDNHKMMKRTPFSYGLKAEDFK